MCVAMHEYGKMRGSALLITARPMTLEGLTPMQSQDSTPGLIFDSKRRYCPKGHDTWETGRYADRHCRACNRDDSVRWQAENAERVRELARARYSADPEATRQVEIRKRPKREEWRAANKDRVATYRKSWKANHPEQVTAFRLRHKQRRRARLNAVPHAPYDYQMVVFGATACGICGVAYVEGDDRTLDHIIPITRGGGDTPENVQSAHRLCNSRKGNRV
jgi:5-methylcytosine-specific restriction endonuclease McrA